ncbi:hypothetical protein FA95DRAFT_1612824 [Auriscalpium vulgare]|uniref:Uncharacterized protein n=1 Tax=Auriscalpium vulgare TaxID=40419 RepID=A0ACB8R510_9AGAM|nr:hypothetical protein FA95DRAFT_1612824 [Auriscalpium vulgare]
MSLLHHPLLPSPIHVTQYSCTRRLCTRPTDTRWAWRRRTPHGLPPITPSMPSFLLVPAAGMPFVNLVVGMPVNNDGSGGDYIMGINPGYYPLILGSGSVQGKGSSGLAHEILKGAEKHSAKVNGIATDKGARRRSCSRSKSCACRADAGDNQELTGVSGLLEHMGGFKCRPELKVDVFWEDKGNDKEREKRHPVDDMSMQRSGSDPV